MGDDKRMDREIVAHRGWSGKAPENTMAAFELAASDPRIGWIELDVQLSKDGVPVVIHDFTLKRTTGAAGRVKDYTFAELEKLDCGSWFSKNFAGERIPSLEQVLLAMKDQVKLNIELKTAIDLYPGLEKTVTDLIRSYSWTNNVVLTSFDHYAVQRARIIDPSIHTGLILSGLPMMVKEQLRFTGASMLSMDYRFLSAAFVHDILASGIDLMAWTVNDPEAIRSMLAMDEGLMICTNYPERVFAAMAEN